MVAVCAMPPMAMLASMVPLAAMMVLAPTITVKPLWVGAGLLTIARHDMAAALQLYSRRLGQGELRSHVMCMAWGARGKQAMSA